MALIKKIIIPLCLSITGIFLIFHFLFIWMFEHGDSYYYLALAQFWKTGIYPFQEPFVYLKPTTIASPLYSVLLFLISFLPRADIWLHGIQLIMLASTAYILYLILRLFIRKQNAVILSCLYIFIPTNIAFASYVMTEIPALLGYTYFVYRFLDFAKTKNKLLLGKLIFLAAILTLLRYQFVILLLICFVIYLFFMFKKANLNLRYLMFPILSILIIFSWIWYNHEITGVWGISDTNKIRYHAAYVYYGQHFPKETDPSVIEFRKYVPNWVNKYAAWWEIQDYVLPKINRDWHKFDDIVGNVGIAAVKEDPLGYLLNTIKIFIDMHQVKRTPWWFNIIYFGIDTDWAKQAVDCKNKGTFEFCHPIIKTDISYKIWDRFFGETGAPYMNYFPIFAFLVLFPLLLINLILGKSVERLLALFYIVPLLFSSTSITPEPRYLFTFYPIIIMISVTGSKLIIKHIFLIQKQVFTKNN
jgi:4-amino-4-deoxy-L-arabinose transferase-like glycosyltransferase